jgi:hypothetical protein
MKLQAIVLSGVVLWSPACSGGKPDLPPGWENAQSVKSFTQAACSGSPGLPTGPNESVDVTANTRAVSIAYHAAHFRCAQSVEGFVRTGTNTADFLVQPTDMNPSSVAGCDCLYEITMGASVAAGATTVTVYRRWDHQSGSDSPVEIGAASANVP